MPQPTEIETEFGVSAEPAPEPAPNPASACSSEEPGRAGGAEVCPFCGAPTSGGVARCDRCGAHTDPLSRQATQNEMGPWFVRDPENPFRPGCRLETIERWARSGRITAETVLRGPTTHQNWMRAERVPGVAHLLGRCHACRETVGEGEVICRACGSSLSAERDRQHLGLSPVRAIPGRGDPAEIARTLVEPTMRPLGAVAPTRRVAPTGAAPAPESVGPAAARLDRRLRTAQARARGATLLAAMFGVLFAASLVFGWIDSGRADAGRLDAQSIPEADLSEEVLEPLD